MGERLFKKNSNPDKLSGGLDTHQRSNDDYELEIQIFILTYTLKKTFFWGNSFRIINYIF